MIRMLVMDRWVCGLEVVGIACHSFRVRVRVGLGVSVRVRVRVGLGTNKQTNSLTLHGPWL